MSQLPPHSLEVERATLSVILIEPKALDTVSDTLKPEHFYSDGHRRVYEACLALNEAGTPIDVTTVGTYLRDQNRLQQVGGIQYLMELLGEAQNVKNIEAYAKTLAEKWRLREAITIGHNLAAEGYTTDEPEKLLQRVESSLQTLSSTQSHSNMATFGKVLLATFADYNRLKTTGVLPGMRTGFRAVDAITGGFHKGDLTVLAARPGMGKTAFALQLATNIKNTIVFSLEMPAKQLVMRVMCGEAKVSVTRARNGLTTDEETYRIIHACDKLAREIGRTIWIDDTPAPTLMDIRARTRRIQATAQVDFVVIDYLQLMSGRDGARSREQEISEISRGLKGMAKELNVSVLALSQLNRAVENRSDKRPMLSDLRESGAIEQDADNIAFIYREGYYNKNAVDTRVTEIIYAKQRNGPTDTALVDFDGERTRFEPRLEERY